MNEKGKTDYHTFKPVLFEFPTYEYFYDRREGRKLRKDELTPYKTPDIVLLALSACGAPEAVAQSPSANGAQYRDGVRVSPYAQDALAYLLLSAQRPGSSQKEVNDCSQPQ